MKRINVRNKKEFDAAVKEYRSNGYMIITFGKLFAELEKNNEIIIVEK